MNQETVRALFTYKNGHLYWKPRPRDAFTSYATYVMWNKRYANRQAGNLMARGYIKIGINKKYYREHRLVWLYHKGWMPESLDHKNGIRSDNRIANLRPATAMENCWNSRRRARRTTTNIKGVYKRGPKMYEAHISSNYVRYYLGRFVRKLDAFRAVNRARKALHKAFARAG